MSQQLRYPLEAIATPLNETLLGTSPSIQEVVKLVQRLAPTALTVLISGESGTGKDVVSRMLHRLSPRGNGPFIKVNCPAIPESMMESELFGHEKGAFTGARTSKPGRLELAHHGTLFLDEIGEIPYPLQGKLLQVLDGEPVMRIGGVDPIQCEVRLIAATNKDLEAAVRQRRLREDIFFRLSEVHVHLPPLRDRREDVALLAEHFNYNYAQKSGKPYEPIPESYLARMTELPWKGNVRELSACVRKYAATGNEQLLFGEENGKRPERPVIETMPTRLVSPVPRKPVSPASGQDGSASRGERIRIKPLKETVKQVVEETERALILEALKHTFWNRRKAAKLLKVSYSSLLRRIEMYNIGKMDGEIDET
jgi:two-component system, NtrC family, response regulator AtoC